MKHGLLLINLGTPNTPDTSSVRSYLREFLTDKRVIDLPFLLRYLLVYFFIVPFRSKQSAHAYRSIWTNQGSPLLVHCERLVQEIQKRMAPDQLVALAMRYGKPSIETALSQLRHCESITILPLYPQYSSAANGSSISEVMRILRTWERVPSITILSDFFQHPAYIKAQAQVIKPYLQKQTHVLFSYHGIPERQNMKGSCQSLCVGACPPLTDKLQDCYRAQCHQSSYLLAEELELSSDGYSIAFQSRLGKTPWIKPYTDLVLADLIDKGVKELIVISPSFVADCLETLEELGIRLKQQWLSLGGQEFTLVPCMNAHPLWVKAVMTITQMEANADFRSNM
ncbi:ferrochelatase [Legionella wadsworthii]|uniref:Ferrochelatase n=1 Tax=Legionella wadsworthii TaxID=28088 RepID=A0A378LWY4_9GAMM|nr:ferrochelatase [Legionella wadsworthii]STY30672.1 ferrochelatase [Legionella wadsworthii]